MSKKGKAIKVKGSLLVGVIGDEATVTGFLLTGIGERNKNGEANFLIVTKDTAHSQIETAFQKMVSNPEMGIIMISQNIAESIRNKIAEHEEVLPTIMEIPSKDVPYDPTKDTVLCKAARMLYGNEVGMQKLTQLD
jgi:V-type H+-transporting ATPase subunit F